MQPGDIKRQLSDSSGEKGRESPPKKARFSPTPLLETSTVKASNLAERLRNFDWRTSRTDASAQQILGQRQDVNAENEKLLFQYEQLDNNFLQVLQGYANSNRYSKEDRNSNKFSDIKKFKEEIKDSIDILLKERNTERSERKHVVEAMVALKNVTDEYRGKSLPVADAIAKAFDKSDRAWNESKEADRRNTSTELLDKNPSSQAILDRAGTQQLENKDKGHKIPPASESQDTPPVAGPSSHTLDSHPVQDAGDSDIARKKINFARDLPNQLIYDIRNYAQRNYKNPTISIEARNMHTEILKLCDETRKITRSGGILISHHKGETTIQQGNAACEIRSKLNSLEIAYYAQGAKLREELNESAKQAGLP